MTRRRNDLMPRSLREATEPVFHYTSSNGLLGIVESKCVRASEASGLNDKAEIRQGWSSINDWLSTQPASDAIDLLRDFAADPMQAKHEIFVLSGSTASDDANQWRLYAQGGSGYAIEFDPSVELVAVSKTWAPPVAPAASRGTVDIRIGDVVTVSPWFHVLYTGAKAVAALEELVASVESEVDTIDSTSTDTEERDVRYEELKGDAYEALATIAHLIKASGFSGENEVRVVTSFLFAEQHIQYRAGEHGIVGFTSLTTTPTGHPTSRVLRPSSTGTASTLGTSLPVRSVRLGPLLNIEHENTVRAFLRKNGLGTATVTSSAVPLR
jgi:Protein of unknown function (DUF2971)